jgi:hypothetical protein
VIVLGFAGAAAEAKWEEEAMMRISIVVTLLLLFPATAGAVGGGSGHPRTTPCADYEHENRILRFLDHIGYGCGRDPREGARIHESTAESAKTASGQPAKKTGSDTRTSDREHD